MNKLQKLIGIIKAMNQQVEFIEHSCNIGLCTEGEAIDALNRLEDDVNNSWEEEMMKEQIEDNKYQGQVYN